MLLGAQIRLSGRSAIYLGGALQVWFGVMGGRFFANPALAAEYKANRNWTRPSNMSMEKPFYSRKIEGGAYW